ncbi:MAG: hypothetical protein ACLRJV_08705 [Eubacteriales bacterium]
MDLTETIPVVSRDGFGCTYGARGQAVYGCLRMGGTFTGSERTFTVLEDESLAAGSRLPIRSEVALR